MIKFLERLFARLAAPYGYELARLPDEAFRSLLARMAPEDQRNQLFGLFTLSGKATAFLGPMLVGMATLASGSQRVGMTVILLLWLAGLALLLTVPADRSTRP